MTGSTLTLTSGSLTGFPADGDLVSTPDDTRTDQGVAFPLGPDGRRSTTATGRAIFADAARVAEPALATAIEHEDDWRKRYGTHVRALAAAEVRAGRVVEVARVGLDAVHDRFEFVRGEDRKPLRDAVVDRTLDEASAHAPSTLTVEGEDRGRPVQLTVPYRGEELHGDTLHRQLDTWVDGGLVEASFAEAIRRVVANPDWLDLSDLTVAVLGAGAEMGPLPALAGWRANVLAVDLPRPKVTERITALARGGNGTVHLPRLGEGGEPGADLLTAVPELAAWLAAVDVPLVIGTYVYAEGADHVRVAVAADAIVEAVSRRHGDVAHAVLATPTDVYAVPEDLVADVRKRADERRIPVHERLARTASRGALYAPSYPATVEAPDGRRFGLADAQVAQQGPNYSLAKRLQRWRALVGHADGHRSSVNVAPATSTRSVTKNRLLAAAYAGASRFGVEVFEPDTSNALMAAMLVHDLRSDRSSADPTVPGSSPLELFVEGAAHGGLWRVPWQPPSVLGVAAGMGLLGRRS